MKAILYSINLFLLSLIVLFIGNIKELKNKDLNIQKNIFESADPKVEEFAQIQRSNTPSDTIVQRSIFHIERREPVTKEVSTKELEAKVIDNKNYILTGIVQFGNSVAMIAVEEKQAPSKRVKTPRIPSIKAKATTSKMYMLGEQIEGSNYKLKSINAAESFVILSDGQNELKLESNSERAKEIARNRRERLNQLKKLTPQPKAPAAKKTIPPKRDNQQQKGRVPAKVKTPERVI